MGLLFLGSLCSASASPLPWPGDGGTVQPTRTATVVITALDPRGEPFTGALVKLLARRADADLVVLEARTDSRGRAVFESTPPGRYRVRIVLGGDAVVHHARRPLVVPPGETIHETYEVSFFPPVPARF